MASFGGGADILFSISGTVDKFVAALDQAKSQATDMASKVSSGLAGTSSAFDGVIKNADKLKEVGTGISAALTLPIAGAGVAIGKFGLEFSGALADLQARGGMTAAEIEKLKTQAISLGRDFDPTQVVAGMTDIAAAGRNAAETGALIGPALQAATALGGSTAEAAAMLNSTMSIFNIEVSKASSVVDTFAGIANKGAATQGELANVFRYTAVSAKDAGISFGDLATSIALVSNKSIDGERAGTGIRGVIEALTAPSTTAARAFRQMGVDVESAGFKGLSFKDKLATIKKGLEANVPELDRAGTMTRAFGTAAGSVASILVNSGAQFDSFSKEVTKSGQAAELQAKKLDSAQAAFTRIGNTIRTAAISAFVALEPTIKKVLDAAQGLIDNFILPAINAFGNLPAPIQVAIVALAGIAAAIGPLLVAAGTLASAWGTLSAAFAAGGALASVAGLLSSIGAAIAPVIAVAGSLTAGVVAVAAAFAGWVVIETIRPYVSNIVGALSNLWKGVVAITSATVDAVVQFASFSIIPTVTGWVSSLASGLGSVLGPVITWVFARINELGGALQWVAEKLRAFTALTGSAASATRSMGAAKSGAVTPTNDLANAEAKLGTATGANTPALNAGADAHGKAGGAKKGHAAATAALTAEETKLAAAYRTGGITALAAMSDALKTSADRTKELIKAKLEAIDKSIKLSATLQDLAAKTRQAAANLQSLATTGRALEAPRTSLERMTQAAKDLEAAIGDVPPEFERVQAAAVRIPNELDRITASIERMQDDAKALGVILPQDAAAHAREVQAAYERLAPTFAKNSTEAKQMAINVLKAKQELAGVQGDTEEFQRLGREIKKASKELETLGNSEPSKAWKQFADDLKGIGVAAGRAATDALLGFDRRESNAQVKQDIEGLNTKDAEEQAGFAADKAKVEKELAAQRALYEKHVAELQAALGGIPAKYAEMLEKQEADLAESLAKRRKELDSALAKLDKEEAGAGKDYEKTQGAITKKYDKELDARGREHEKTVDKITGDIAKQEKAYEQSVKAQERDTEKSLDKRAKEWERYSAKATAEQAKLVEEGRRLEALRAAASSEADRATISAQIAANQERLSNSQAAFATEKSTYDAFVAEKTSSLTAFIAEEKAKLDAGLLEKKNLLEQETAAYAAAQEAIKARRDQELEAAATAYQAELEVIKAKRAEATAAYEAHAEAAKQKLEDIRAENAAAMAAATAKTKEELAAASAEWQSYQAKAAEEMAEIQKAAEAAHAAILADIKQKQSELRSLWSDLAGIGGQAFRSIATAALDAFVTGPESPIVKAITGWLKPLQDAVAEGIASFLGLENAAKKALGAGAEQATDAAGAATSGAGAAGSAGAGGGAAAAGGGWMGIVNMVSGVVTAISSVFGNFQMAAMNKTLDLIEQALRKIWQVTGEHSQSILWSTQKTAERLEYVNGSLDTMKSLLAKATDGILEIRDLSRAAGWSYLNPSLDQIKGDTGSMRLSLDTIKMMVPVVVSNNLVLNETDADRLADMIWGRIQSKAGAKA